MLSGEVAGFSDQEQGLWNPVHHHDYHQPDSKHPKLGNMDGQLRVTAYRSDHSRDLNFSSTPHLG